MGHNIGGPDDTSGNKSIGNIGGHDDPGGIKNPKHIELQRRELNKSPGTGFPMMRIGQHNDVNKGEVYQGKVTSYGQQLQFELKLRGWKEEQLAAQIGVSV